MPETRRSKILLIEDNPRDRSLIRQLLEVSEEYCVIEVGEAEEGLKFCETVHIDCIILDLQLPGMDGLEFMSRIKSIYEGTFWPVVVLTGEGDENTAVDVMKRGAHDYLIKAQMTGDKLRRAVNDAVLRAAEIRCEETALYQVKLENEQLRRRIAELDALLSEAQGKLEALD